MKRHACTHSAGIFTFNQNVCVISANYDSEIRPIDEFWQFNALYPQAIYQKSFMSETPITTSVLQASHNHKGCSNVPTHHGKNHYHILFHSQYMKKSNANRFLSYILSLIYELGLEYYSSRIASCFVMTHSLRACCLLHYQLISWMVWIKWNTCYPSYNAELTTHLQ